MLEARIGVDDVPAFCHRSASLAGEELRHRSQQQIEQPEEQARMTTTTSITSVVVHGFLARRPDHLAQLEARLEQELPDCRPSRENANTRRRAAMPPNMATQLAQASGRLLST